MQVQDSEGTVSMRPFALQEEMKNLLTNFHIYIVHVQAQFTLEIPVYSLAWSVELTCVPYCKQQAPSTRKCLTVLFTLHFHKNNEILIGCAASGF